MDPLRELASILRSIRSEYLYRVGHSPSSRASKPPSQSEPNDLLELFYKYAREDSVKAVDPEVSHPQAPSSRASPTQLRSPPAHAVSHEIDLHQDDLSKSSALRLLSSKLASLKVINYEKYLTLTLSELEELNYSRCFPFHRKNSLFHTQSNKLAKFSLKHRSIKPLRYTGTDLCSWCDPESGIEQTSFVLITEKKWEFYMFSTSMGKTRMVAMGKLTGEFSNGSDEYKTAEDKALLIRNDFKGNSADGEHLQAKLKSWVQLSCKLSRKYLVIGGTKGMVRILNVDPSTAPIGAPVYTYLTNFPIRCVAIAPDEHLIACGITAREKSSGKQQPFIVLHHLDLEEETGSVLRVDPVTITVPYRDPLKLLEFNSASTHLICCTVYELRYFIIRLRNTAGGFGKPRLIWSDLPLSRQKKPSGLGSHMDELSNYNAESLDDQMMDNEGITSIAFGKPGSNHVAITTSTMKNRPPIVLKLFGAQINDSIVAPQPSGGDFDSGLPVHYSIDNDEKDEDIEDTRRATVTDAEVIAKVPEVGSWIHRAVFSPRGNSLIFVEKSGKLFLVSPVSSQNHKSSQANNIVVILGEAAGAQSSSDAASVRFSTDGGKVFVIDRKGLFQVFDFCKGTPGDDPEVIKCKIVSV